MTEKFNSSDDLKKEKSTEKLWLLTPDHVIRLDFGLFYPDFRLTPGLRLDTV